MAREINLVPDIKGEMIKTLKLRNFIFFLCIIVAAASVGITVIFGLIAGGQSIAVENKKATLDNLSAKLNSYSDLGDFLTIKDQLGNISTLTNNKKVLSRTFNILSALIPTGADSIVISELNVDLSGETPIYSFDAQANAGKEPFIDYGVLESFKKSMDMMHYDYGKYVDAKGNRIPSYCMIESGDDGATFSDASRGIFAFWTIDAKGCDPSKKSTDSSDGSSSTDDSTKDETKATVSYNREEYKGQSVVRIWRTPQFSDWYKEKPQANQPSITLSGEISNVPHFESSCIHYTGDDSQNSSSPKWTESENTCKLIPGGSDGINVSDSSNGRDASEELVLKFSATLAISPEAYKFSNAHLLALAPSGRHNVTDSYVQIQAMFGERAADCPEGDTACSNNAANRGEKE